MLLSLALYLSASMAPGAAQTSSPPAASGAPTATVQGDPAAKPHISDKQKAIDADTEKLVQMAAELKISVDKSNKNQLSLDVVRKAEAVEKLAKSLKERIREAR